MCANTRRSATYLKKPKSSQRALLPAITTCSSNAWMPERGLTLKMLSDLRVHEALKESICRKTNHIQQAQQNLQATHL